MSMRVLQLCWGYPPEAYDGASGSVGELCKGLFAAGLYVAAVSIEPVAGWDGWVRRAGDRGSAVPLLMPGHEKLRACGPRGFPATGLGSRSWPLPKRSDQRSLTSMSIAIWPWSDTRPGGRARVGC